MDQNQSAGADSRAQISQDVDAYLKSANKAGLSHEARLGALIQQDPAKAIRQLALHEMMLDRAEQLGTRKTLTNSVEFEKTITERKANKQAYVETLNSVLNELLAQKQHQDVKAGANASQGRGLPDQVNQRRFSDTAQNLLAQKGVDVKALVKAKLPGHNEGIPLAPKAGKGPKP